MSSPFLLVLLVFASARLTRLVTVDTIAEPARTWLLRRLRRRFGKSLASGLACPWCLGFWASASVVAVAWLAGYDLPLPLLWPWAVAGGQMLVNGVDLTLDRH